jgi:hypothetical protein
VSQGLTVHPQASQLTMRRIQAEYKVVFLVPGVA